MGLFWRRPPKVEKYRRSGNVEGLLRALRYEDPITDRDGRRVDLGTSVREAAAEALAEMEGSAARDGLQYALADPEESVRATTIRALREHGGEAGTQPLVSAVTGWTDPEREPIREEALEALASLHDPDVPRHVAAQLLTRDEELEEADAQVLRRVVDAGGPRALHATIEDLAIGLREGPTPARAAELLVVLAPDSVEPVIELLDDPHAQEQAALTLGSTHDSRAVEPLCSLLREADDTPTRRAAAWALGEIRDLAAAETLLVATGDRDYAVRAAASAGFDNLGNAAIAVALSTLLRPAITNGQDPASEPTQVARAAEAALPPPSPPPPPPPLAARAAPVLRRLLGRTRR